MRGSASANTLREAWRQLHRSASECSNVWKRIRKDFDQGSFSSTEQLAIITAVHDLGQFHNRTIRKDYLPRRSSSDVMHFWRDHELRIQKTVFDYCNADIATRQECSGKDNDFL